MFYSISKTCQEERRRTKTKRHSNLITVPKLTKRHLHKSQGLSLYSPGCESHLFSCDLEEHAYTNYFNVFSNYLFSKYFVQIRSNLNGIICTRASPFILFLDSVKGQMPQTIHCGQPDVSG